MSELKLEKEIELDVSDYAKHQKDCLVLKLNVWGRIGWPDRLYLHFKGKVLFIEFKQPGEKPKRLQEFIHEKLRRYGFRIEVVDNVRDGRAIIDDFTSDNSHV